MFRLLAVLPALAAACASFASSPSFQAGPVNAPGLRSVVPVDGSWIVLNELMTANSFYSPIFTYSSATPVQLDVTDLFVVSDTNEVYLDFAFFGVTPTLPDWQSLVPAVGPLDPPYTADPAIAWTRPEFSKQSFLLPAGNHTLTFRNVHIPLDEDGQPFADGTMAFRLVPEPSAAALLGLGALVALLRRRSTRRVGACFAALLAVGLSWPNAAIAGSPCGTLNAMISGNALEIAGTTSPDSIRVVFASGGTGVVEIYSPAEDTLPSCTFDPSATPFDTIRVFGDDGDDLVVFDDQYGALSDSFVLDVDGGDGADTVLGGIDLNAIPLANALTMINTLQQAQTLIDEVLDLLDAPVGSCNTASCLVTNSANVLASAGDDLVRPTALYVRDIDTELVQPSAAAVQDAHGRIANYLQTFVVNDVQGLSAEAQTFVANVEVSVDEFELLLPVAQDLLARADTLYARARSMGLNTQNGDSVQVFKQTVENHSSAIELLSDLCDDEAPEPVETEPNEDLQDPNGLPPPCAELERRVEALEAITDDVEASVDAVEAEGDAYEADGNALEASGNAVGDDEDPNSAAALRAAEGDALVATADALSATADALNADWEQWIAQTESTLGSAGNTMDARGQAEIDGAAMTLAAQADADIAAAADGLRLQADQIAADLDALLIVAAPLLRDDITRGTSNPCPVTATNTIVGGAGSDVLIGSTGSDELDGGDGADLLIGAGGADRLLGGDGNDLLFGGGGADEIDGGPKVDIIVGNAGDDCLYGGGGQTLARASLSVDLGDIFFGLDGDDRIFAGDGSDNPAEIDVAFGGEGNDLMLLRDGGNLTIGSFTIQLGNVAFGGPGMDDIQTGAGIDVLFGDADADMIASAKGAALAIGSGSSAFRLALGDLIFGGDGPDTIDSDDPNADRADDDIDVIFGGIGADTIRGYGGGALSIGDPNNPDFELRLGNLVFGGDDADMIDTLDGIDVIFGGNAGDTISTGKGDQLTIGSGSSQFRLALGDLIFGGEGPDTVDSDDPNGDRADDDIDVIFGAAGADVIHGYGGGLLSIGDPNNPDFELRLGNVIFGGDDGDMIDTLDGIDLIFGGNGPDTVEAGKGYRLEIDTTFALEFGDLIFGQAGADVLHGDAPSPTDDGDDDGIDIIFGGDDADQVYGGAGGAVELPDQNFCLIFGNLLFGGDGPDLLRGDYQNWDPNDLQPGIDLIFGAGDGDTIEGSAGSLIVIGNITTGQAVVIGFGNLLFGGPGNDVITGADAAYICTGQNDDLDDLLNGLGITDLAGATDLIFCGEGSDTADAYDGIDFVFGSEGDDVLRADDGGFIIIPISGVPTPIAFGNLMFGGNGEDNIRSLGRIGLITVPPLEIDLLFGGKCDDVISAGDGLNLVFGNDANDTITAGNGINVLFGNKGMDDITAGSGLNVAFGNDDDDIVSANDGVNVLFGNKGRDTVIGDDGLNICFGNKGDDTVQGGDGLNILFGNAGMDSVAGGAGLSVVFGNSGCDQVSAGSGLAVLFGNGGDDEVTGANGVCVAFGNAGNDIVTTGSGLSVLFGNSGEDRLRAGSGLSVQFGNSGNDIIEAGGGGVFIAFGNSGDDVLKGAGGLNLCFGNRGSDQVFGGGGTNITFGNADNDYIRGGNGTDFLFGNRGDDQIVGADGRDFVFGNRDNDTLGSDGGGDFMFGNRGSDTVRSCNDGSTRDWLFGNRGDDSLYGCSNSDKLFGGRGSDNKDKNDCGDVTLPAPARGEVRGRVLIDLDGDGFGDVGQPGVTVMAGSSSAVTDADGKYRIAGLAPGSYTVAQTVPGGFMQTSIPAAYSISVGSMGVDLFLDRDFVNLQHCFVAPDGWSCLGGGCNPGDPGCKPVAVRQVLRCPDTGEICDGPNDCPCGTCVPSWAIVECACNPDCYIVLDPATGPTCSNCIDPGGAVVPCDLQFDGDVYRCVCPTEDPNDPCPTDVSDFFFTGQVISVNNLGVAPFPWNTVTVGTTWGLHYWFIRSTGDQDPAPAFGDYPAVIYFELQAGAAFTSGVLTPTNTLIRNTSMFPNFDAYEVILPVASANATALVQLRDFTQTAWTLAGLNPRDALPLCPDVVLDRFGRRVMNITGLPGPAGDWQIVGSVDAFECFDCTTPPMQRSKPRRDSLAPQASPPALNSGDAGMTGRKR